MSVVMETKRKDVTKDDPISSNLSSQGLVDYEVLYLTCMLLTVFDWSYFPNKEKWLYMAQQISDCR